MPNLIETIKLYTKISPETEQAIDQHFQKEEVPPQAYLIKEDQYCNKLYFLESGVIRTYYYRDGKDISNWFYTDGQFLTSWYGFYTRESSTENIQALEKSIVYSIEFDSYQKLNQNYPEFVNFCRVLAEEQVAVMDLLSKGYAFATAREKYEMFMEYFPEVLNRVNLGMIASFLGISQETLSRIRKRK